MISLANGQPKRLTNQVKVSRPAKMPANPVLPDETAEALQVSADLGVDYVKSWKKNWYAPYSVTILGGIGIRRRPWYELSDRSFRCYLDVGDVVFQLRGRVPDNLKGLCWIRFLNGWNFRQGVSWKCEPVNLVRRTTPQQEPLDLGSRYGRYGDIKLRSDAEVPRILEIRKDHLPTQEPPIASLQLVLELNSRSRIGGSVMDWQDSEFPPTPEDLPEAVFFDEVVVKGTVLPDIAS